METHPDTDVLIVGGGPAGLAAAMAARHKGFRVLVADCARPPIDKACGEGLMPDGVAALRQLGFGLDAAAAVPFRGIRFRERGISVEAAFPEGPGMGIRRTALHRAMAAAAERAGIALAWGARVSGLAAGSAWIGNQRVTARWIVGADGGNSRIRTWAGLPHRARETRRFGFRRHYRITPWTNHMELYWGRDAQIYVTAVGAEEVCVVVVSRDSRLRVELQARLSGAAATSTELGAVTASRRLARVTRGRIALIGDASGSVDAITGEGLCLAFQQALALARALEQEDLAIYEAAHRRLMRRPSVMSSLLLALDGRPWLRRPVLRAFQAQPRWFETLLALHVGARPAFDFAHPGRERLRHALSARPPLMRRS